MAGIRTENKIYEVGIYCRLSRTMARITRVRALRHKIHPHGLCEKAGMAFSKNVC